MTSIVTSSLLPDPPPRRHDEEDFQRAVIQYLRWSLPPDATAMAIPNGGLRHSRAAARLAGQGVVAGAPDLLVVYRGKALFLELKTPRGRLSEIQRQFHKKLHFCGAEVMLCTSLVEIEAALREIGVPLAARTQ